jgi:hypothetical protein
MSSVFAFASQPREEKPEQGRMDWEASMMGTFGYMYQEPSISF